VSRDWLESNGDAGDNGDDDYGGGGAAGAAAAPAATAASAAADDDGRFPNSTTPYANITFDPFQCPPGGCLFNIIQDPTEHEEVSAQYPGE
jgi:hypothetical protein